MKWHLSRVEGWRPRKLAKRDAAAIVGSAFAAGIAVWNRVVNGEGSLTTTSADAAAVAQDEAERQIARLLTAGCTIPSPVAADFEFAPTIAARAVERVCADDPIPADWTIVDVERPFEEHGNARPDLVCRDEAGRLVIVDYKCAMALKDAYLAERFESYRRSPQMHHYVWAAREVYGDGPGYVDDSLTLSYRRADVTRYAIVLVRIEPWKVVLQPYDVDERILRRWTDSAWATWERMATPSTLGPESNWEACVTKYGPCEMTAACWDHALDPELIALDYVRIPREEAA